MTKVIGLTGGIGSGKTTIANHFMASGVPVYIADDEARKIMDTPEIIEEIRRTFGSAIFTDNILNRKQLADIVFNNPEQLKLLNGIIHPAVKKHFDSWILKYNDKPFVVYEAAILFESGNYKNCNQIITVTAPLESRIQRVMNRDKTTRDHVLKRINAQWSDEQRIAQSDFVIENTIPEITRLKADEILKILNN